MSGSDHLSIQGSFQRGLTDSCDSQLKLKPITVASKSTCDGVVDRSAVTALVRWEKDANVSTAA